MYNNHQCVLNKIASKNYRFNYGDILDESKLQSVINQVDVVVMFAGLVGDPITKKYPDQSIRINDVGVKTVIDLCASNNTKKFIFVSTCSNYGLIDNDQLADENHQLSPLSTYAKHKVSAEKYILSLNGKSNFNPTILRFATAFGLSPRMRFDLTINEFTRELLLGRELLIYDAHTWRPYCHVQDFARLISIVIDAPVNDLSFQVFNSGGDLNNATKQTIVETILKLIPNGNVRFKKHGSDPRNYRVSFEKVKSVLGFEPQYTIQAGINELIEAINNHVFDHVEKNLNFFGNYEIDYSIES